MKTQSKMNKYFNKNDIVKEQPICHTKNSKNEKEKVSPTDDYDMGKQK